MQASTGTTQLPLEVVDQKQPKELTLIEVNQELKNMKSDIAELKNMISSLSQTISQHPVPRQLIRTKSTEFSQNPYLLDDTISGGFVKVSSEKNIPPEKFIAINGKRISDSQLKYPAKK